MTKIGRVTNYISIDSISEVKIDKFFLKKVIFDPSFDAMRHEFENHLKNFTITKCKIYASFNSVTLSV